MQLNGQMICECLGGEGVIQKRVAAVGTSSVCEATLHSCVK